jgi:hypothetical protein
MRIDTANGYTAARTWAAEGARVGAVTCKRCGVALLLDVADSFDVIARHDGWHSSIEAQP